MTLRPHRLRKSESIRRMVRETVLTPHDLIYPLFVMEGVQQKVEVPSMPDCYRYSLDELLCEIEDVQAVGIGAIACLDWVGEELRSPSSAKSWF